MLTFLFFLLLGLVLSFSLIIFTSILHLQGFSTVSLVYGIRVGSRTRLVLEHGVPVRSRSSKDGVALLFSASQYKKAVR
jgi:hypothetical protein